VNRAGRPLAGLLIAFVLSSCALLPGRAKTSPPPEPRADLPPERLATERAIARFEDRVREDSRDFVSYTILGQLYLRKGREAADLAAYVKAEEAFRQAIAQKDDHVSAKILLATALASQHRFHESLALAREIYRAEPTSVEALATMGDALLEIGRYRAADTAYRKLQETVGDHPAVLARLSQIAELRGDVDTATALVKKAAERAGDSPEEDLSWYQARLGEIYYQSGRIDEAERSYQKALELRADSPPALVGLADVRAAQERSEEALKLLRRAVELAPEPAALAKLGDLEARAGNGDAAEECYAAVEEIASRPGAYQSAYARELALFYADHRKNAGQAVELAARDLGIRRDVYAFDTLAWVLYRSDRIDDARRAIDKALRLGTRDATLHYHAGMIYLRAGDPTRARTHLREAVDLARYLVPEDGVEALSRLGEVSAPA
jgi:tetratricopeptide (TPR) repeat protein